MICLGDGYGIHNVNIISWNCEVINTFPGYMIPVDCCEMYKYVINFTSDEMIAKIEDYAYNKSNTHRYIVFDLLHA